jgi:hypothetical protein
VKALAALLTTLALFALPATATAAAAASPLSRTVHAPFGTCKAKQISMKVSLPRLTFTARQAVTVTAVVTNEGTTGCTFNGGGPPIDTSPSVPQPPAPPLSIGPCSALGMQFDNAKGVDIWPDKAAFSCPALSGRQLTPGDTLKAVGEWNQQLISPEHGRAPRGHYKLVVDRTATFAITLR